MPIFKTKNENFFKKWSPKMAYVLGFFAADGNLIIGTRGNYYLEFTSTDQEILEKIKSALNSNNKITFRKRAKHHKTAYRIQIGSKIMSADLLALGITPRKSLTLQLPNVPDKYFGDFLRGYFDGDGSIVCKYFRRTGRKIKSLTILTRFTTGSKKFAVSLKERLSNLIDVTGSLFLNARAWRLNYSKNDSRKLYSFMYKNKKGLICLERKLKIYTKAFGVVV